jgi:hypothetical protein
MSTHDSTEDLKRAVDKRAEKRAWRERVGEAG